MGLAQRQDVFVETVNAAQVQDWLDGGEVLLVDVRETKEYEVEHIAGALLLPLSSFDPEFFPAIDGKHVVIHCAVGKRSEAAAKMLLNEGHVGILHMEGGLKDWKAAGLPTEVQILPPEAVEAPKPVFLCPTPGEVLRSEFLEPLGIDQAKLALRLNVSPQIVRKLVEGALAVDVELSMRLARYFCTAADFWVHVQTEHDLERARHAIGEKIRAEVRPRTC
ncbi:HigA family addiction module antitoxin [Aliiroseovarius subalbicans]|uniref:HigA family addiction module antitoxin n=1 Tax=Aliiroseovarius subalbicans TaxID=2925840 RepID=UPI001F562F88|nr:HigA family addiction module antitoxin [Aliiroseovarius subalbicans]MCI2398646.1 HigA family addiction module antitoxin [Aliiroseovarius subalbicans]